MSNIDNIHLNDFLKYKNDIISFTENCTCYKDLDIISKLVLESFIEEKYLCVLKKEGYEPFTALEIICAYIMIFNQNISIGVITLDTNFIQHVNTIIKNLPIWMRPYPTMITDNRYKLENGCTLRTVHNRTLNWKAHFVGVALHILLVDDAQAFKDLNYLLNALTPVLSTMATRYRNQPHGMFISGILHGRNDFFKYLWCESKEPNKKYQSILTKPISFEWEDFNKLYYDRFHSSPGLNKWYLKIAKKLGFDQLMRDHQISEHRTRLIYELETNYRFK